MAAIKASPFWETSFKENNTPVFPLQTLYTSMEAFIKVPTTDLYKDRKPWDAADRDFNGTILNPTKTGPLYELYFGHIPEQEEYYNDEYTEAILVYPDDNQITMYTPHTRHFTEISGSSITIKWDAVPGAKSYKVYYAFVDSGAWVYIPANPKDPANPVYKHPNPANKEYGEEDDPRVEDKNNISINTNSFTHTGLKQATRYSYWITFGNDDGWSMKYDGYIGWVDTEVDHLPDPVKPKIDDQPAVKAENGPMNSLRWLPSPGATKYRAYWKDSLTSNTYHLITFRNYQAPLPGTFTEATDTVHYHGYEILWTDKPHEFHFLEPNTAYYYYVEAGNTYGWSDKSQGYIGMTISKPLPTPPAD
jgi:hypothetical protein